MLRGETGRSTSVAQGQNEVEALKTLLRRTQERLYQDYDWEFLVIDRDESLVAGSRYYSFDAELEYDRVHTVWVQYSDTWREIEYGILPEHYNVHDSDADERQDPVKRWRHYEATQYEVWPIPVAAQSLRMRGVKKLVAMTSDSDVATLDDQMIVLFAAAELLERSNQRDASMKLASGQRLFDRLKGRSQKAGTIIMGGGLQQTVPRRFWGGRIGV